MLSMNVVSEREIQGIWNKFIRDNENYQAFLGTDTNHIKNHGIKYLESKVPLFKQAEKKKNILVLPTKSLYSENTLLFNKGEKIYFRVATILATTPKIINKPLLIDRALTSSSNVNFTKSFERLLSAKCDIFICNVVYLDMIKTWIITSEELEAYNMTIENFKDEITTGTQTSNSPEKYAAISQKNLKLWDKYRVKDPNNMESYIRKAVSKITNPIDCEEKLLRKNRDMKSKGSCV